MGIQEEKGKVLKPLTARQQELMRVIQSLDPNARHTLKVICRGSEPWEIQEVIEHRKLGEMKPGGGEKDPG
jgi:hypothetical protein